jgi:hypothetical protein
MKADRRHGDGEEDMQRRGKTRRGAQSRPRTAKHMMGEWSGKIFVRDEDRIEYTGLLGW